MRTLRTRLLLATALAGGVLPAAVPPAAQAGPAAWATTLVSTSAREYLSAFPDGTAYASVGVVSSGNGEQLPEDAPVPRDTADSVGFLKSTDFGQTWSAMSPPPPTAGGGARNLMVRFATPAIGYASYTARTAAEQRVGPISLTLCLQVTNTYKTIDGGKTWQPVCEPQARLGGIVQPETIAVGKDGSTFLQTGVEPRRGEECDEQPVVHFSSDSGRRWTRGTLPRGYYPGWSAQVYDRQTAAVIAYQMTYGEDCGGTGDANAVFLTTDGGRTWRKSLTCPKQPICTSVGFVSRTRLLVGRTDGSTMATNDGGRRWLPGQRLWDTANDAGVVADKDRPYWHWVQSFAFADAKTGYASTRGSGTWRTADGGKTWTQELSHECAYHFGGIGENAVATPERAITGGPGFISARVPTAAGPPVCHPTTQQVPAGAVAAVLPYVTVGLDGALRR